MARKYTTPILKDERITDSGQPTGESLRPLKRQDLLSMVACEKLKLADPVFYREETLQYAVTLGRSISKAVYGELNSQQALDEAAEECAKIYRNLE